MSARAQRRRVRGRALPAVVLAVIAIVSLSFLSSANAGVTDVDVGPSSGPVGTTVTVSGWACPPGILINPSRAGVLIVTLGVTLDVAVPADGAWSLQFEVPPGALPGPHAIVATCTRDLVLLPYAPLTFTVTAPAPPPPTTTVDDGVSATTTTIAAPTSTSSTTVPPTTAGPTTTTSLDTAVIGGPGDPPAGDSSPSTVARDGPAATTPGSSSAPVSTAVTTTHGTAGATHAVAAARLAGDDRRPLVFGALSPIGHGWMGLLISALIVAAFVSAVLAILWFRWLRHTRAREWWLRWSNQILRIRAHARPRA